MKKLGKNHYTMDYNGVRISAMRENSSKDFSITLSMDGEYLSTYSGPSVKMMKGRVEDILNRPVFWLGNPSSNIVKNLLDI